MNTAMNWAADWQAIELLPWIVVFLVSLVFLPLLLRLVLKRFFHFSEKLKKKQHAAAVDLLGPPIYIAFSGYGLLLLVTAWISKTESASTNILSNLSSVQGWWLFLTLAWLLLRMISLIEQEYQRSFGKMMSGITRRTISPASLHSLFRLLRIFVGLIICLGVLDYLGFSVSTLLTFGGLGTIVIGFAGKDILSNFFSGFLILKDRPFTVGDWIKVDALKLEGTVKRIGWRVTEVQSFDKRPLYVPNYLLVNNIIENPQRMTHRRIYEKVGIRFEDIKVLPKILGDVREYLKGNAEIAADQIQLVFFNAYEEGKLDFFIYVMTNTTDWKHFHVVKEEVLFKIGAIIRHHGAEIDFPLRELYYQNE